MLKRSSRAEYMKQYRQKVKLKKQIFQIDTRQSPDTSLNGQQYKYEYEKSETTLNLKRSNEEIGSSSKVTRLQDISIISRVYLFLENEYEYMQNLNGDNCDLSPLADILKRTAEATGVSEDHVITILETEELSDHLPKRAKRKMKKIHKYTKEDSEDTEDLIEDNYQIKIEHEDIKVQKEAIEDAASKNEPTPSKYRPSQSRNVPIMDTGIIESPRFTDNTSNSTRTQIKLEYKEVGVPTSINNFFEVTPLVSNNTSDVTTEKPEDITIKLE